MQPTQPTPGLNTVRFPSAGETLQGHLFLPEQTDAPLPLIVVTGSWTTVKEQMPDLYARRLAAQGYATLTFDFRFYGQSGGAPRQVESPANKTIDILHAIEYAATLPGVDPNKIGALSICASSGYMADALSQATLVRSLVMVAPWLHNPQLVGSVYGGEEGAQKRIAIGKAAREKYEQTGEVEYVKAASADDQSAAMAGPFDYYLNPQRGAIPEWDNRFAVMSWTEWLTYDAIKSAPQLKQPTLIIHSEKAAIPDGAKKFFSDLKAPKDIFWTEGTQLDFYDQEPQVSKSVDAALSHFRLTL